MKKLFFLACFSYGLIGHAQIEMNSYGRVSVGNTTPYSYYDLTVTDAIFWQTVRFDWSNQSICDLIISTEYNGSYYFKVIKPSLNNQAQLGRSSLAFNNIYSYGYTTVSDGRQKENVRPLTNSLDIIKSLSGVKYDLKPDIYLGDDFEATPEFVSQVERDRKDHLGFIAQEVNEVLPEIVEYDDSTDVYSMDYTKIIPVLVEAVKEQQEQISQLNAEISALVKSQTSNKVSSQEAEVVQDFEEAFSYLSEVQLYQNTPNPFIQGTEIRYYLPDQVRSAMIHIFDLNGIQVKSFLLDRNGNNSVIINAGELKAGMYLYSLVADSHFISTKRMIITE